VIDKPGCTGNEVVLGGADFNIYRAIAEGGLYKINSKLIPTQGDPVAGASYSFSDSPGPGAFRYILTDVDLAGELILHGPVMVQVPVQ
jgi:hypothetical protein